jgi:hypothetical protein
MTTPPSFPTLPGQSWSVHKRPTFSTRVASHVSGREVRSSLYADTLYEFEVSYAGLDSAGVFTGVSAVSLQTLMGFYLSCQGQFGTFLYTDPTDNAVMSQTIALGDGATTSFIFQRSIGGYSEPVSWVGAASAVYLNGATIPSAGLSAPSAPSLSQVAGGTLGAATAYVKTTYVTASGETAASSESSLAVSASHLLQVASPAVPSPASATGWNVYAGAAAGTEVLQNGATPIALGTPWTEPTSGLVSGTAVAPSANTTGWSLIQPNTLTFVGPPKSGVTITSDFSYAFLCRFLDDQEDFEHFMSGLWKLDSLKFRSVKP